jgi:hypothetical protein
MAALVAQASPSSRARIEAKLDAICVELVCEWIVGEARFESQTQQVEHWLGRFYQELWLDERPDPARLYARFGVSLPRAQYLARLLRARLAPAWRSAAREEVRRCLETVEADACEAGRQSQAKTQRFDCSLSRAAYDELLALYEATASQDAAGQRPAPPRVLPSSPNIAWFSLTAETVLAVLAALRDTGRDRGQDGCQP